ncbi:hypothetical protein ACS0TY_016072 [Phlomoides rotata]
MASSMTLSLLLLFAFALIQLTLAEIICENLPENLCCFAVASSGKRCVLENYKKRDGKLGYTCKTSEVVVESFSGHIETDQCVSACGVDRTFVGISSDAFLTAKFTSSLCSQVCYKNCPNIVDLYFNLAAGEGVFLPHLCRKQKANPHRAMLELLRSGGGGTTATVDDSMSPAPAPAPF